MNDLTEYIGLGLETAKSRGISVTGEICTDFRMFNANVAVGNTRSLQAFCLFKNLVDSYGIEKCQRPLPMVLHAVQYVAFTCQKEKEFLDIQTLPKAVKLSLTRDKNCMKTLCPGNYNDKDLFLTISEQHKDDNPNRLRQFRKESFCDDTHFSWVIYISLFRLMGNGVMRMSRLPLLHNIRARSSLNDLETFSVLVSLEAFIIPNWHLRVFPILVCNHSDPGFLDPINKSCWPVQLNILKKNHQQQYNYNEK